MSITLDAVGTATGADQGAGNHAFTGSITIGTLTNGILIVALNGYSGSGVETGVRLDSSTGTALTALGTALTGANSEMNMQFFYLLNPPSGAHTFYVSGPYAAGSLVASSWSGVQQVAPTVIATGTFNSGAGETLTGTTVAGDVVIDGVGSSSGNGTTASPAAGQTQLGTLVTGLNCNTCSSYQTATGASTTMAWTGTTTQFSAAQVIALVPASGSSSSAPHDPITQVTRSKKRRVRGGALLLAALTVGGAASGSIPTLTLSPPAGTATGKGTATGAIPTLTLSAPTGSAVGGTGSGPRDPITVVARVKRRRKPTGGAMLLAPTIITSAGAGTGAIPTLTLSPVSGTATGKGTATGSIPTLTLSSPAGSASVSGVGNASGAIPTLTLAAPAGTATGKGSASGAFAALTLAAATGTASGKGTGAGALPTMTLTAPAGSASGTARPTTSYTGTLTSAPQLTATLTSAPQLTGTITTTPGSHT